MLGGGKSRIKWILSIYKVNVVEVVNLLGGGSNKYVQENIDTVIQYNKPL